MPPLRLLLSLFLLSLVSARLERRQEGCVSDIYCAPRSGDLWRMDGTVYQAYWNTEYPRFKSAGTVIVMLVDVNDPTSHLQLSSYPTSIGYAPIKLSDLEFGGPNDSANFREKQVRMVIYPINEAPSSVPPGPVFSIAQKGKNGDLPAARTSSPTATSAVNERTRTVTATSVADSTSGASADLTSANSGLAPGAIAGIAVGSLAALVSLVIVAVFARRRTLRARQPPAAGAGAELGSQDMQQAGAAAVIAAGANGSVDSAAPLIAPTRGFTGGSLDSPGGSLAGSNSALSTNDAMMIAATYRQLMRKPSWSASSPGGPDSADAGADDETRRGVANKLLEQELKEEGVGMTRIKHGSGVHVNDVDVPPSP